MVHSAMLGRLASVLAAGALLATACSSTPPAPTPPAATTAPTSAPNLGVAPGGAPSPAVSASPAAAPSAAVAVSSPAAVASPSPSPSPIPGAGLTGTVRIVSSLPRTGTAKAQTDSVVNAIKMAIADVNGKIGNATIDYVDMNDATPNKGTWDGPTEQANANKALNDPDVMGYIGPYNSLAAEVSIPILCQAGLVMVSPSTTYPGLTKDTPYNQPGEPGVYYPNGCARNYTRVTPTDDVQGAVAAAWAKQLGAKSVYVLNNSDPYGEALSTAFADAATKIGLTVVGGPEGIDPKASGYRTQGQKIAATNPDLVYFGGTTDDNAGQLWQDLRATLSKSVKLMGPDGINEPAFVEAAGSAAEGTYATLPGVPPSKLTGKGAQWYTRYKQQYQGEPDEYAAYAYDATGALIQAITNANTKNRATVRQALFATRDYSGALGTWSFTATGDTTLTSMSGRQVVNGKWDDSTTTVLQAPQ